MKRHPRALPFLSYGPRCPWSRRDSNPQPRELNHVVPSAFVSPSFHLADHPAGDKRLARDFRAGGPCGIEPLNHVLLPGIRTADCSKLGNRAISVPRHCDGSEPCSPGAHPAPPLPKAPLTRSDRALDLLTQWPGRRAAGRDVGDHLEDLIGEAADVDDVIPFLRLHRRLRLDVDADHLRRRVPLLERAPTAASSPWRCRRNEP